MNICLNKIRGQKWRVRWKYGGKWESYFGSQRTGEVPVVCLQGRDSRTWVFMSQGVNNWDTGFQSNNQTLRERGKEKTVRKSEKGEYEKVFLYPPIFSLGGKSLSWQFLTTGLHFHRFGIHFYTMAWSRKL